MKKMLALTVFILVLTFVFAGTINAAYDFGGETITITSDDDYKWDGEDKAWLEEVEKMFNVNIEAVDGGGEKEFTTSVLAGDPVYDIYFNQRRSMDTMAPKGVLYPLENVVDQSFWSNLPTPADSGYNDKDNYTIGGHLYGIPRSDENSGRGNVVFYNKELLAREGLADIDELVENGEWTWDKFREYARAATKDTDGDGEIDQWGWHRGAAFRYFLVVANDSSYVKEVDGKLAANIDSPAVVEAYQFYHDLTVVDGSVSSPSRDNFAEGRVLLCIQPIGKTWVAADAGFDWGIAPIPMGPRATEYRYPGKRMDSIMLPATIKSEEKARGLIELATALYKVAEPYVDTEMWRQERIDSAVENVTNMYAYEFIIEHNFSVDLITFFRYFGLIDPNPTKLISTGEKTAAAAMAEARPQFQAILDQLNN